MNEIVRRFRSGDVLLVEDTSGRGPSNAYVRRARATFAPHHPWTESSMAELSAIANRRVSRGAQ
jgi:hypothetical protein